MMIKYFLKRNWCFFSFIVIIVVTPLVETKSTIMSASMMDYATNLEFQKFIQSLAIVLVLFAIHGILLFCSDFFLTRLISGARESLREEMFEHIVNSPYDVYKDPDIGFYITSFSNDITILEYKYFEPFLVFIQNTIAIIISTSAIFALNRKLAFAIIIGEIASVCVCILVRSYSIAKNKLYIKKLALFTQRIKDYFTCFQTIHNYSVEDKIKCKFSLLNHETEISKNEADASLTFANTLTKVCNSLLKFIIVGYGIILMMNGEITIGLIYAAYQFCNQIISPMQSIISSINSIESVKSIIKRIKELFEQPQDMHTTACFMQRIQHDIQLSNVSLFANGAKILDCISHTFQYGKKYLIIGKNGSGKSTMLRLLKKSTVEYKGDIIISGENLLGMSQSDLGKRINYINENVSMFCDTVKNNILLFRDVSDDDLKTIVKKVGLSVPLDRVIKDGERNLSSGETRRIEIARSLVGQPEVIIYDEAVSTLDVQTAYNIEKMLLESIDQTVIFVSHNFSSLLVNQYDEIILMENGKITDYGTHIDLSLRNDYYRKITKIKTGEII